MDGPSDGETPRKKKKWDFDSTKCIVCRQTAGEKTSAPSLDVLQKIHSYVKERHEYGASVKEFWEAICDVNLKEIISSGCVYHRSCYADVGNKTKRDRCKQRNEKLLKTKECGVTRRHSVKPIGAVVKDSEEPSRMVQSQQVAYDRDTCVICQRKDGVLHRVSTFTMGQKLFECASLLQKKDIEIWLNSVCNPIDAVANDILYHLRCFVYLKRQAGKDVVHKAKVVADIEILNLVEYRITQGQIIDMNSSHTTYKSILLENGVNEYSLNGCYKKYLKQLIEEKVEDVKFVNSLPVNEPMQLCSSQTESNVLDSAGIHSNSDDFNILLKAAKLLRSELSSHSRWHYKGTFDDFKASELLSTFVKWLIVGPHMTLENIVRSENTENTISIITEMIMQSFKTNHPINYKPAVNSEQGLYSTVETRSKRLIDHSAQLNLSIPYEKVLRLESSIANKIHEKVTANNDVYIPRKSARVAGLFCD